jgi:hypothetical protein
MAGARSEEDEHWFRPRKWANRALNLGRQRVLESRTIRAPTRSTGSRRSEGPPSTCSDWTQFGMILSAR